MTLSIRKVFLCICIKTIVAYVYTHHRPHAPTPLHHRPHSVTTAPTPASLPPQLRVLAPNPHHYTNYTFCPIALHSGGITGTKWQWQPPLHVIGWRQLRGQSLNQTPTAKLAQNMQNCHTNVMPPRPSQLHPLQLGVLVLLALSPRSSLIPILTFQWHFWGTRS